MPEFSLPHDHGSQQHIAQMHKELRNLDHFSTVSDIFKQLSDPTRVRIFWLLSHQEACVVNIAAMLDMSSPAISHHLRSLTECGLLVSRRSGREVYYRAADSDLHKLLHEIVEQVLEITCPEKEVDYNASQDILIHQVHDFLAEHLNERITIEALSKRFLMNTTTLKTTFKKVYGESIAMHMKRHRMEHAAELLLSTQNDIASIAQAVGYESQSRFSDAFREAYGLLPTEYRRMGRR